MSRFAPAAALVAALTLSLAILATAAAQESTVHIADLECATDPETVVLENSGDTPQDLNGWQLQSDPDQTFDLSGVGSLQPGATVTIQSGPAASGVFSWTTDEVFRDDDATDYARLVDGAGATVDEAACAEAPPEPTAEPTEEPTPEPVNGVPTGGGPPPPTAADFSTALLLAVGAAALGAGALAVRLSRRP